MRAPFSTTGFTTYVQWMGAHPTTSTIGYFFARDAANQQLLAGMGKVTRSQLFHSLHEAFQQGGMGADPVVFTPNGLRLSCRFDTVARFDDMASPYPCV